MTRRAAPAGPSTRPGHSAVNVNNEVTRDPRVDAMIENHHGQTSHVTRRKKSCSYYNSTRDEQEGVMYNIRLCPLDCGEEYGWVTVCVANVSDDICE